MMVVRAYIRHLMSNDDVVLGINRYLHVVADNPGILATCRHRARVRIGQRDLLVLALFHLFIDRSEPRDLLLQLRKLVLEPCNLRFRYHITAKIGGLKLRQVPRNALLDTFKTPPHLGFSEVLVARIDGLELRAIDRDARRTQQIKLAAQRHKSPPDFKTIADFRKDNGKAIREV